MSTEGHVEVGVAKHRADVDRQAVNEPVQPPAIVKNAVLQNGYAFKSLVMNEVPYPPPERGARIIPEIKAVLPEDSFQ